MLYRLLSAGRTGIARANLDTAQHGRAVKRLAGAGLITATAGRLRATDRVLYSTCAEGSQAPLTSGEISTDTQ